MKVLLVINAAVRCVVVDDKGEDNARRHERSRNTWMWDGYDACAGGS